MSERVIKKYCARQNEQQRQYEKQGAKSLCDTRAKTQRAGPAIGSGRPASERGHNLFLGYFLSRLFKRRAAIQAKEIQITEDRRRVFLFHR
jgi:hypothetical protein